jgi:hypothetical protein
MRGIEIWRSGGVQSPVEEITAPAVSCLIFEALSEWHFGETCVLLCDHGGSHLASEGAE